MSTTNLNNIPIRIQSGIPVQLDDHPFNHRGQLPWASLVPVSLVLNLYQKSDNSPSGINNTKTYRPWTLNAHAGIPSPVSKFATGGTSPTCHNWEETVWLKKIRNVRVVCDKGI